MVGVPLRSGCVLLLCAAGCGTSADPELTGPYGAETQASGWGEEGGSDPASTCIVDGELQRPLWIEVDEQLVIYEPGGPVELPLPGLGSWLYTDASPSHVAVTYYADDEGIVRLFARGSDELIWERRYPDGGLGRPIVHDDGRVLVSYDDRLRGFNSEGGLLLAADGDIELPWILPRGRIDAHGWAPAMFVEPDNLSSDQAFTGWGWVAPSSGAKLTLAEASHPRSDFFRVEDGAFEYIDDDPEVGLRLLHAEVEGSHWIELPAAAQNARMLAYNDRYRLLELWWSDGDDDSSLARVSITDGELLEFDHPPPPAGFEFFGCYGLNFAIDPLGRMLTGVRDGAAARIAAWDFELETWSLLGLPMSEVSDVGFARVDGEFVHVFGYFDELGGCNGPVAPFVDPPADALLGSSNQLVGVESGLVVPVGLEVAIDEQRVCATWVTETERIVLDLEDGDELTFPHSYDAGWFE